MRNNKHNNASHNFMEPLTKGEYEKIVASIIEKHEVMLKSQFIKDLDNG